MNEDNKTVLPFKVVDKREAPVVVEPEPDPVNTYTFNLHSGDTILGEGYLIFTPDWAGTATDDKTGRTVVNTLVPKENLLSIEEVVTDLEDEATA